MLHCVHVFLTISLSGREAHNSGGNYMDELNQFEYSEWLHWCGYTDAEMYSWPLDNDPAYMAGFAEGYAQIQMEGSYENFTS